MKNRADAGMSLIEVLIALSILAVGLLGLATLQITAIKGNASANETVAATYYAQSKLEELRRLAFDNVSSSPAGLTGGTPNQPDFPSLPGSITPTVTKKGVAIYRVWSVETTTATLKTITVWACWQDQSRAWHIVQLVTRKGNVL